jgi:hypothetical protein
VNLSDSTPVTADDCQWQLLPFPRPEDCPVPDDPDLLADYVIDLHEDLCTVRLLLSEALSALQRVTKDRDRLRWALRSRP